jgi:putative DNA primase/helicase
VAGVLLQALKAKMPRHQSQAELEKATEKELDPAKRMAKQASIKGFVAKWRAKLNTARYEASVLSLASEQPCLLAKQEDFDADLFLLGAPGGVVDLRSGHVRPARPEDLVSRSATVAPSEEADCPKWVKFVGEINDGDEDMVAYFARLCGCFLTGSVSDEVLTWWYGKGGNGKGTAIETLKHILGAVETSGYATDLPVEAVMFKKAVNDYSIQNDIAKLQGARLAVVDEGEKHSRLNSSLLNRLTGGGRITGKLMRENKHEFPMTHKLVILSNHRPRVECDDAMKRRLNLIPFLQKWVKHTPSPEEKKAGVRQADLSLKADLLKESPSILRWAINGCLSYLNDGLKPPQTVTDFTTLFFEKADQYEEWVESRRHKWDKEAFAATDELFADWVEYCKANQQWVGDKQAFSEDLGKHDKFRADRDTNKNGKRRGYRGLLLNRNGTAANEPRYDKQTIKGQRS